MDSCLRYNLYIDNMKLDDIPHIPGLVLENIKKRLNKDVLHFQ